MKGKNRQEHFFSYYRQCLRLLALMVIAVCLLYYLIAFLIGWGNAEPYIRTLCIGETASREEQRETEGSGAFSKAENDLQSG